MSSVPLVLQRRPFFLGPKGEPGERDILWSTALRDIVSGKATLSDNVTWDRCVFSPCSSVAFMGTMFTELSFTSQVCIEAIEVTMVSSS